MRLKRTLLALILFGIAFGYVEAAVVVYLRTIFVPIRQEAFRTVDHNDLFPLLTVEHLQAAGPEYAGLLGIEMGREAATIVMLAAAGLAIAGNFRQWLAGFMIAFGSLGHLLLRVPPAADRLAGIAHDLGYPLPGARSLGGAGDRAGARLAVDDRGRRGHLMVRGGEAGRSASAGSIGCRSSSAA